MLNKNDKVALVVTSNGKNIEDKNRLESLEKVLKDIGLVPIFSTSLYKNNFARSASAKVRAQELMKFYKDENIKAIFDISGGDIANEILDYLDFDVIKNNYKPFFGYSDVSTVLNALLTKIGKKAYLYQILNIIEDENFAKDFAETLLNNKNNLTKVTWNFLQGESIKGEIVGGNIRCFLKLAGTEYFPDLEGKVLFLEGMSTSIEGLITHLAQLKQIGAFKKISGLLLGTFTKIEVDYKIEDIYEIVKDFVPITLPVAKTQEIGHEKNSKMLVFGENIEV